ncbi:hypothetical protein SDC9_187804 [bioreactor metagenome]|uniref:Uncharacterized protein n=1 Tax=bioreactor metagenome TaxID=1076179 RepID=A0A645HMK1_9ZZZZ
MVFQEDLHVDQLAAFGVQAQIGNQHLDARAQCGFGALQRGPAWVAFVVASSGDLGERRRGVDRLHAVHAAHAGLKAFNRIHHRPIHAGLFDTLRLGVHRQHVHADGVVGDDVVVVAVVAGICA